MKNRQIFITIGFLIIILILGFFIYKILIFKNSYKEGNQGESGIQAEMQLEKKLLSGYWSQTSEKPSLEDENCKIDEYIFEFTREDSGKGTYNSWLHCRPFEMGTWNLLGDIITMTSSDGTFTSTKISIENNILELGDLGNFTLNTK
ncbi:MAG: hypothetical protein HY219_02890 [Candidatus Staskawiczbacteria bacterium]|nr:hypothetical protein [Candidatus Staskawiczbacteria bacterium]